MFPCGSKVTSVGMSIDGCASRVFVACAHCVRPAMEKRLYGSLMNAST